jgi:hypothetical protein
MRSIKKHALRRTTSLFTFYITHKKDKFPSAELFARLYLEPARIKEQDRPPSLTTAIAMPVTCNDGARSENVVVEPSSERIVRNSDATFPFKLYDVLEDASAEGFDHIISWMPNGNGFKLHDRESFKKTIVARYFNRIHYKSFIRQLNLYDFQRQERGSYFHDCFVRGERFLCRYITRYIIKNNRGMAGTTKRIGPVHGGHKGSCSPSPVLVENNEAEEHLVLNTSLQWCTLEHLLLDHDDHDWRMDTTSLDDGSVDFEPDPILVTDQVGATVPRLLRITCIGPDIASDIIAMFRRHRVSVG